MKTRFVLLVMATILFTVVHDADAQEEQDSATMLDTVVVTATKIDDDFQTGDVDQETTPAMTTTIERSEFEGKTESLAEVIEKEVGVQVQQSGGLGSFSSVSLRGSSSEQVMVFMDGILLNDASGGGVDLSAISLSDVAAIEIYRGATPINFGSSSIGGVVNIRTLRSKEGLNTSISGGYGSFSTYKANALINHKPGRFDYLFSADYLDSENDFEYLNDRGTDLNPDDDRWEKRNNAQVEQANLLAKVGYDFSDTFRLDLINQTFVKEQGIPSWANHPSTRASLDTKRNIATAQLTADDLGKAHLNTRTRFSYAWKEEEYDDRLGQIGLDEQLETYKDSRINGDFFVEWLSDKRSLTGTIGLFHEAYETKDLLLQTRDTENYRDSIQFGLQYSRFFFDETVIVTPAIRHTWVEDELDEYINDQNELIAGQTRSDHYNTRQIGIVYKPWTWMKIKSNAGKYVRQPSFFELIGDRGVFKGNPDLVEEKGSNFDIGVQCDWADAMPRVHRLSVSAAYFHTDAENLITRTYDSRGIGKSVNNSSALIRGIETRAIAEFFDYFRASANITYQDPKNESEDKDFSGKRLSGRYEFSFCGKLEVRFRNTVLYGEYTKETGIYYDTANNLPAEDKRAVNAGLSYSFGPWHFQLEGKNLTDELYEDFNGWPTPGRSYYASVKYNYSK